MELTEPGGYLGPSLDSFRIGVTWRDREGFVSLVDRKAYSRPQADSKEVGERVLLSGHFQHYMLHLLDI